MDEFNKDEQVSSNQTPFQNNGNFEYQNANGDVTNGQVNPETFPAAPTEELQFQQPYVTGGASFTQPPQKPPRKSHGKLIALLVAIVLILAIGITCYAKKDYLLNTIAISTKSPQEYYTSVEKNAIKQGLDSYIDLSANSMQKKDLAYKASTDITYDRETVSALLQNAMGMSMEDLESYLGFNLESIGTDFTVASKDGNSQAILSLDLNQINLISAEFYMNYLKQEILVRVPELSAAWMNLSTEATNTSANYQELFTPEIISELVERYSYIIVDHINKVELNKNKELKVDTISEECTELVATLEQEDLLDMLLAILEEAKDDDVIFNFLPAFQMSKEDYLTALEQAITDVKSSENESTTTSSMEMILYVDKIGNIIGRQFDILEDDASISSFGYYMIEKNNSYELKAYLNDDTGAEVMGIVGSAKKDSSGYNGECTVNIKSDSSTSILSDLTFKLAFENVKKVTKNNRTYSYGTYTLSSISLMGMELILDCNVVDDVQQVQLNLQLGSTSLLTLNTKLEVLDDYSFTPPSETDQIYDTADSESYLQSIDFDKFTTDLSEKLGSSTLKDLLSGLESLYME